MDNNQNSQENQMLDSDLNFIEEGSLEKKIENVQSLNQRRHQLSNDQQASLQKIYNQFRVVDADFYFKDLPDQVAFKDKGERIVASLNDDRVTQGMVTMAQAKGWQAIKVSGHPEFQRKIWMEGNKRGIDVQGYEPTEQDLQQLNKIRASQSQNTVEKTSQTTYQNTQNYQQQSAQTQSSNQAAERTYTGRVLQYGRDYYNHDSTKGENYFVKLATNQGEKTVWGVALEQAMSESEAKIGDHVALKFKGSEDVNVLIPEHQDDKGNSVAERWIQTKRNAWEVITSQERANQASDIQQTAQDASKSEQKTGQTAEKTYAGQVLNYGRDRYNHDNTKGESYFVKLATNQGEKTIWGVALEQAMSESEAKIGDHVVLKSRGSESVNIKIPAYQDDKGNNVEEKWIKTERNTWEVLTSKEKTTQTADVQQTTQDASKSDKTKVAEAVAATFIDSHIDNPQHQEILKKAVNDRLSERAKSGNEPTISVYDKDTSSKTSALEKTKTKPARSKRPKEKDKEPREHDLQRA